MTQNVTELSGRFHWFERWGHLAVMFLLVFAFVTGGGSRDRGIGDVLTQLLALPLVLWAVLSLCASTGRGSWLRRGAVGGSLLIIGTMAIQQLPLPEALWRSIGVREALARDLQAAGVDGLRHIWSLSPLDSERGLWSVMPALAVFLGALALPVQQHRRMLLLVVFLSTVSLVLGFLQLGAPQDSALNPFPEWAPSLNGFFSSPNHQATALAISMVMIAALLLYDWRDVEAQQMPRGWRYALTALGAILLASLPLAGSRAMLLLAVLGLVAVPMILRRGRRYPTTSVPRARAILVLLGIFAAGVGLAAAEWLRFDAAEEVRWSATKATAAMGWAHAPFGAGLGAFVPWFDQTAPEDLIQGKYFNHAHNEYAQWWLESGLLGVASVLGTIVLLVLCYPRRPVATSEGDRGVAVAAWLGCVLMLLHSWVDYPLRTPALMSVAGLLAGIVVAQRVALGSATAYAKNSLTAQASEPA